MIRTKKPNIYKKKLKLHKLAHEIITTKDELKKKKLRIQLKRQCTTLRKVVFYKEV